MGRPPFSPGEKVKPIGISLAPSDVKFLKTINPNISAAIRELIRKEQEKK